MEKSLVSEKQNQCCNPESFQIRFSKLSLIGISLPVGKIPGKHIDIKGGSCTSRLGSTPLARVTHQVETII
jgi:hypothetical protein